MVKFFLSADGKLDRIDAFAPRCWIDMVNPDDDECEEVARISGVPEDMIKAALDEEERARSESDEGCTMFVVDCPIIEEGEVGDSYTTLPLAVIYNKDCIVTVCLKGNTVLKNFITGREKIDTTAPVHFILTFMLGNAKRFLYCLKQIDRKKNRIQGEMEKTMRNAEIMQLLDLENSLVYFSTSLHSNERVHDKLSKVEAVVTSEEYRDLYDDVSTESKQAIETCHIYKDILSVTMDAYGSMISNNANITMRKLTIITIILAIPTMIAGFWGMNMPVPFQYGVSAAQTVWFWVVIACTAALTAVISVMIFKTSALTRQQKIRRRRRDKN